MNCEFRGDELYRFIQQKTVMRAKSRTGIGCHSRRMNILPYCQIYIDNNSMINLFMIALCNLNLCAYPVGMSLYWERMKERT
ncbi:hypothetical protein VEZ01S_01_00040 [Vibrio ezurae NBRC 102218]|uniref:Uncharacterized protein n=1 Tax=Vibrio ezurae NBRC 102218 TaxID=1219080 RepID=U3AWV8_9VIBR|nr:hypothetical protein VEZ01S_01_00040 [Vibrio ezurae NBRC 102218]